MSDSIASYAADQAYKSYPNILDSRFPSFAEASEGHCAGMTQHRNMNSESKFKPEIYKSPNVEEKETSRDDLKRDASELASLIGLEISESDLRVAVNGPSDETEKPILFRLGEMSARMEYKADTSFKDSFEKRSCGSKCLLLRGIQYIKEIHLRPRSVSGLPDKFGIAISIGKMFKFRIPTLKSKLKCRKKKRKKKK